MYPIYHGRNNSKINFGGFFTKLSWEVQRYPEILYNSFGQKIVDKILISIIFIILLLIDIFNLTKIIQVYYPVQYNWIDNMVYIGREIIGIEYLNTVQGINQRRAQPWGTVCICPP